MGPNAGAKDVLLGVRPEVDVEVQSRRNTRYPSTNYATTQHDVLAPAATMCSANLPLPRERASPFLLARMAQGTSGRATEGRLSDSYVVACLSLLWIVGMGNFATLGSPRKTTFS